MQIKGFDLFIFAIRRYSHVNRFADEFKVTGYTTFKVHDNASDNSVKYKWTHCLGEAVQTILCNASDGARGAQLFDSVPFFVFNWRIIK